MSISLHRVFAGGGTTNSGRFIVVIFVVVVVCDGSVVVVDTHCYCFSYIYALCFGKLYISENVSRCKLAYIRAEEEIVRERTLTRCLLACLLA